MSRAKEQELKLGMLAALIRSQHAIAHLLEVMGGIAADSPQLAPAIQDNIQAMARLQQSIAEQVGGCGWREVRYGLPGKVWLSHPGLQPFSRNRA